MALVIPVIGKGHTPGRGPAVLVVILDRDNLIRMHQADPFDLQLRSLGSIVNGYKLEDLDLVIAFEEDVEFVIECAERGDLNALIGHIERGRRHQVGDATGPVSLLKPKN